LHDTNDVLQKYIERGLFLNPTILVEINVANIELIKQLVNVVMENPVWFNPYHIRFMMVIPSEKIVTENANLIFTMLRLLKNLTNLSVNLYLNAPHESIKTFLWLFIENHFNKHLIIELFLNDPDNEIIRRFLHDVNYSPISNFKFNLSVMDVSREFVPLYVPNNTSIFGSSSINQQSSGWSKRKILILMISQRKLKRGFSALNKFPLELIRMMNNYF
jgi:hypothetical protein